MSQCGLFSAPIITAVGDPYIDPGRKTKVHGMSTGLKQFGIGKGIPGKFDRLYEGEKYKSVHTAGTETRMQNRKMFRTPNGFVHSSPLKKSASTGDYHGTFTPKGYAHLSEGGHGNRNPKTQFTKFQPRKIYTCPPKKTAGGSQSTTPKLMFQEFEYIESPYDANIVKERQRKEALKEKFGERAPFRMPLPQPDPIVADDSLEAAEAKTQTSGKFDLTGGTTGTDKGEHRAFRPSSPSKQGALYGTLNKYPNHMDDPFDDKKIRSATMSSRLLPMVQQVENMSEKLRERRAWAPTSPAKSMYTKSIMDGIK